ncbi:hypothetical protein KL925_005288 [Ogataea polymorpha]|nr:hypothetical protein KL936_005279 [Ogataea polymorpha]KAG7924485.1 hypothetical protein KL925_005288 [Ogataea polymorpha]
MAFRPHSSAVTALALSASGRICVSACVDSPAVALSSISNGEVFAELANDTIRPVTFLGFDPVQPQRMLSCSGDAKLWDIETLQPVVKMHGSNVVQAAYLDNGVVAGCSGTGVDFYDSRVSGRPIGSLQGYHTDDVLSIYACSGTQFVSGGNDGVVNLFDLRGARNVALDTEIVFDMFDRISVTQVAWKYGRCFAKLHGVARIVEIDFVCKNNEITSQHAVVVDQEKYRVDFAFAGETLVAGGDRVVEVDSQKTLLQGEDNEVLTRLAFVGTSGLCASTRGYIYSLHQNI